jgi:hypothetical protein
MIAIIELPTRETHPISEHADRSGGALPNAQGWRTCVALRPQRKAA